MKVLLVASEAAPFIKTGGLGDVAGAMPKELVNLGVDVRVVIPKYKGIKEEFKSRLNFLKWFTVPVGWRTAYCGIFEYSYENVTFYFIDNEQYFGREGLYGYFDDGERFAFFDRAVLQMLKEIDFKPDIVHCNDWHSGMIPVMLKLEYCKDIFYSNIKTLFSIHNLLFQGNFSADTLTELFGYDQEPIKNGSLEFYGGMSFMKGGINYSDKISTVSYTYANEIQNPYYGENLDGLLRSRNNDLIGILNGIDYSVYNPEEDKYICKNYVKDNIEEKLDNKKELQSLLGLEEREDVLLVSIISRLTSQKGLDLVKAVGEDMLKEDVQLVVLGTGDREYEDYFNYLQHSYPGKVSVSIKFDDCLAHKIYAGSDLFLMPSLFEPCGLGQLIALRYGTIPLVRETGGLKDTVTPYNEFTGGGIGFSFRNYNAHELLGTFQYALSIYKNKSLWVNIVKAAMEADNSWIKSAQEYKSFYERI